MQDHAAKKGKIVRIPEAKDRPLLTVAETAEALDCSPSSIYRMIAAGKLPTIRLGGRKSTRIVTGELRKMLALDTPRHTCGTGSHGDSA